MTRRILKLALVLLALGQVAATCQGTETGNPGVPSDNPGGGGTTGGETCLVLSKRQTGGTDIAVDDLIAALCNKIVLCGIPTTIDSCFNALNGPDGDRMTDEFGLPDGEFTIEGLRAALLAGNFSASEAGVSSCEAAIGSVDCGEVGANVAEGEFSGTENFIPATCLSVFAEADADAAPSTPCP